jgi:hypothetical protein
LRIKLKQLETETAPGIVIRNLHVLEWNPGNGKWYPINYKAVVPAKENEEFLAAYREAMDRVLEGQTVELGADYNRDHKTLIVFHLN